MSLWLRRSVLTPSCLCKQLTALCIAYFGSRVVIFPCNLSGNANHLPPGGVHALTVEVLPFCGGWKILFVVLLSAIVISAAGLCVLHGKVENQQTNPCSLYGKP